MPDAIFAAKAAGFNAVECHWPYATAPADITAALTATGLKMLGLNTQRGDVLRCFKSALPLIGHVQFAGVPERAELDSGEVEYPWLLHETHAAGYHAPFGAEYKPRASTDAGLGWMTGYKSDA